MIQLIEKNQKAFLALKIVEIIGEDEPHQLDPETVYFVINLLNETDLIKIRKGNNFCSTPKSLIEL